MSQSDHNRRLRELNVEARDNTNKLHASGWRRWADCLPFITEIDSSNIRQRQALTTVSPVRLALQPEVWVTGEVLKAVETLRTTARESVDEHLSMAPTGEIVMRPSGGDDTETMRRAFELLAERQANARHVVNLTSGDFLFAQDTFSYVHSDVEIRGQGRGATTISVLGAQNRATRRKRRK